MLNLHISPGLARFGRFFSESDHTAWVVLALAIISAGLIFAAFLSH
jgi:hypothetical protein